MREAVRQFLHRLRDAEGVGYRFHARGQATLLSTCFAVRTLYLLDALEDLESRPIVDRLTSAQTSRGTFVDPTWRPEETTGSHASTYQEWQTTFFVLSTLDMLGEAPRHLLSFTDPLLERTALLSWVRALDWQNFWYGSNELMFLLYFLAYRAARQDDTAAQEAAQECLDLLHTLQDPVTGYFGHDPRPSKTNRLYGAAHVCLFYDYWRRPLRYPTQAIDTTLSLANRRGLYGSRHGGACEDYDGVEVLLRASAQTDHRRVEVDAALSRTASTIAAAQSPSGGFPYRLPGSLANPVTAACALLRRGRTYSYSGWRKMTSPVFQPDSWATYFRALAVATVYHRSGRTPFRFYDLPAWGYGGVALRQAATIRAA